jgi:hypothetical protein
VGAAEIDAWSGVVGVGEVSVLTSVVRSMIENVSSPTLLMSDVIRVVSDVVGRDVVVGAGLVPATVDTLIPVTSSAVIARTESLLRSIKFFSSCAPPG